MTDNPNIIRRAAALLAVALLAGCGGQQPDEDDERATTAAEEAAEISKAAARGELSCSEARQQAEAVLEAAQADTEAAYDALPGAAGLYTGTLSADIDAHDAYHAARSDAYADAALELAGPALDDDALDVAIRAYEAAHSGAHEDDAFDDALAGDFDDFDADAADAAHYNVHVDEYNRARDAYEAVETDTAAAVKHACG